MITLAISMLFKNGQRRLLWLTAKGNVLEILRYIGKTLTFDLYNGPRSNVNMQMVTHMALHIRLK